MNQEPPKPVQPADPAQGVRRVKGLAPVARSGSSSWSFGEDQEPRTITLTRTFKPERERLVLCPASSGRTRITEVPVRTSTTDEVTRRSVCEKMRCGSHAAKGPPERIRHIELGLARRPQHLVPSSPLPSRIGLMRT